MESENNNSVDNDNVIEKKVAIKYKGMNWGIANVTLIYDNYIIPPRKSLNERFIIVSANYAGKIFRIISNKGELKGALIKIKNIIERSLL